MIKNIFLTINRYKLIHSLIFGHFEISFTDWCSMKHRCQETPLSQLILPAVWKLTPLDLVSQLFFLYFSFFVTKGHEQTRWFYTRGKLHYIKIVLAMSRCVAFLNEIKFVKPSLNPNKKSANALGTKMCSLQLKISKAANEVFCG